MAPYVIIITIMITATTLLLYSFRGGFSHVVWSSSKM